MKQKFIQTVFIFLVVGSIHRLIASDEKSSLSVRIGTLKSSSLYSPFESTFIAPVTLSVYHHRQTYRGKLTTPHIFYGGDAMLSVSKFTYDTENSASRLKGYLGVTFGFGQWLVNSKREFGIGYYLAARAFPIYNVIYLKKNSDTDGKDITSTVQWSLSGMAIFGLQFHIKRSVVLFFEAGYGVSASLGAFGISWDMSWSGEF